MTLTPEEVQRAKDRGDKIRAEDIARGYTVYFTPRGESILDIHYRGFGGELAAARVTGLKLDWRFLPKSYRRANKRPDMGDRVEIRTARATKGALLWASQADPVDRVFLLVVGSLPVFTVCGWLEGTDLKIPENWREPPQVRYPGHFAEVNDLNSLPLPSDA